MPSWIDCNQFVKHLSNRYYNTLVVDCSVEQKCQLPGSIARKRIEGDSEPIEVFVICYDDCGDYNGPAYQLFSSLNCAYLTGGLVLFSKLYPDLLRSSPRIGLDAIDCINPVINRMDSLDSLDTEYSDPIEQLAKLRNHLIDAVWYGKSNPGDYPQHVLDHLFISSAQASTLVNLDYFNIAHIIRIGWGYKSIPDRQVYDFAVNDYDWADISISFDRIFHILESARANKENCLVLILNTDPLPRWCIPLFYCYSCIFDEVLQNVLSRLVESLVQDSSHYKTE
jgi:hypothetical protein